MSTPTKCQGRRGGGALPYFLCRRKEEGESLLKGGGKVGRGGGREILSKIS